MKLKLKGRRFDTIEEIQFESQRVLDTDRKGLPGSVPKTEETVGPVSTCGRELLRGWRRPIGLMVSFMIFTASVRKILDQPSYHSVWWACSDFLENSVCGTVTRFSLWPLRLFPSICAQVSNGICRHVWLKRRDSLCDTLRTQKTVVWKTPQYFV